MITNNGKQARLPEASTKQQKAAETWAKGVCDRVFSHYTEEELDTMRKQNK
jgi:hypothetical protein